MAREEKVLWIFFLLSLFLLPFGLFRSSLQPNLKKDFLIKFLSLSLPVLILFFHAFLTLTPIRTIIFYLTACLFGLVFEILGLKFGTFFGGHYVYQLAGPRIYGVPLSVVVYWGVFIYTGYCFTTSLLYWLNADKPNYKEKNFWLLPVFVFLDGLIVVAIDLFMDPLQVKAGNWAWLEGGPYFGVPVGNFIGWFTVAAASTIIFRSYEYFFPKENNKIGKSIFVIPIVWYAVIYLSLLVTSLKYQMTGLILVGTLVMLIPIILNFTLFLRWKTVIKLEERR